VFGFWPHDQRIATAFSKNVFLELLAFFRCQWLDQRLKLFVDANVHIDRLQTLLAKAFCYKDS
jgi:hypothetical protein